VYVIVYVLGTDVCTSICEPHLPAVYALRGCVTSSVPVGTLVVEYALDGLVHGEGHSYSRLYVVSGRW
jgi:hypothetical protein